MESQDKVAKNVFEIEGEQAETLRKKKKYKNSPRTHVKWLALRLRDNDDEPSRITSTIAPKLNKQSAGNLLFEPPKLFKIARKISLFLSWQG